MCMQWYVDAVSELVTNPYSCIFCGWEVMSGLPMGRDTPLSVCDCCGWGLPVGRQSWPSTQVFRACCRPIVNVWWRTWTDLAHSCDDPTSRGRRSRGPVGSQSLACYWSGIKSEVDPRALVLLVAVVRRPRCSALYSHVYVAKTDTFVRTMPCAYLSHQARRRRHRVHWWSLEWCFRCQWCTEGLRSGCECTSNRPLSLDVHRRTGVLEERRGLVLIVHSCAAGELRVFFEQCRWAARRYSELWWTPVSAAWTDKSTRCTELPANYQSVPLSLSESKNNTKQDYCKQWNN